MNENRTSNKSKKDDFYLNMEDYEYKNLITRLKQISKKISLLEKIITR